MLEVRGGADRVEVQLNEPLVQTLLTARAIRPNYPVTPSWLREHYMMTLRAWLRGLERRKADAIKLVGERSYRVWRHYMSAGAYGFRTVGINVVQTLLSKPAPGGRAGVPLTREGLCDSDRCERGKN